MFWSRAFSSSMAIVGLTDLKIKTVISKTSATICQSTRYTFQRL